MDRTTLVRVALVVALVLVLVSAVLEFVGGGRSGPLLDDRLLPPPDGDPHLLPTSDGLEHGLDDPVRGPGWARPLPDRGDCSS